MQRKEHWEKLYLTGSTGSVGRFRECIGLSMRRTQDA